MPTKKALHVSGDPSNRSWLWLLGLGVLFIVLGTLGLSMVVGITLASMMFLGVLLLIAGIVQIVDVIKSRHWEGVLWHAFVAVLYLCAAGMVIYEPFLASSIITAMLAGILIVIGLTRIFMSIALRNSRGWGWILFAGIISLGLGIIILIQWPWSGLWFIGLFISIEILITGWTYLFFALSLRR